MYNKDLSSECMLVCNPEQKQYILVQGLYQQGSSKILSPEEYRLFPLNLSTNYRVTDKTCVKNVRVNMAKSEHGIGQHRERD